MMCCNSFFPDCVGHETMSCFPASQWLIHQYILRTRSIWQLVGVQGMFLIKEGERKGEKGEREQSKELSCKEANSSLLFKMCPTSH